MPPLPRQRRHPAPAALLIVALLAGAAEADPLVGFQPGPWFNEQTLDATIEPGVRVHLNAAGGFDPDQPTRLIVYALPNGNTIEQTLGCRLSLETDWRHDIQHIAAQTRRLREVAPGENLVLACVEAAGLSWPAWRRGEPARAEQIAAVYGAVKELAMVSTPRVTLAAHSGGGSFVWGVLDAHEEIPGEIDRVALLDANYSYDDQSQHGEKFLAWLDADDSRRLVVLAYDDRNITFQGKRVVGAAGGTYRATGRMRDHFRKSIDVTQTLEGQLIGYRALDGRITMRVHQNPENKILHTALVGDMNGFLYALTLGTPQQDAWGAFPGARAYEAWIQPPPSVRAPTPEIPPRPDDAPTGSGFFKQLESLPTAERDAAIVAQVTGGNVPGFLREFTTVEIKAADADGAPHTLCYQATPDYLAIGADDNWVRAPMTPMAAQQIADQLGCTLPTALMVDQMHAQATVRLEPQPLTERREAPATFVQHHRLIEQQRAGRAGLILGIKKDVVLTNRLAERPGRVAIYGWHYPGGEPIQPVTTVHTRAYVDYSHGVRLVRRAMTLDGQPTTFAQVAADPKLAPLLSNEGPLTTLRYPTE